MRTGDPFSTGECKVCGERVTLLLAPMHAENHMQRDEYPLPDEGPSDG